MTLISGRSASRTSARPVDVKHHVYLLTDFSMIVPAQHSGFQYARFEEMPERMAKF